MSGGAGVRESISSDIANLQWLLRVVGSGGNQNGLFLDNICNEMKAELAMECNYRNEMRLQQLYSRLFERDFKDAVKVPRVVPALCSECILTAEMLRLPKVSDCKGLPQVCCFPPFLTPASCLLSGATVADSRDNRECLSCSEIETKLPGCCWNWCCEKSSSTGFLTRIPILQTCSTKPGQGGCGSSTLARVSAESSSERSEFKEARGGLCGFCYLALPLTCLAFLYLLQAVRSQRTSPRRTEH